MAANVLSFVPEEKLRDVLENLHDLTGWEVRLIDPDGVSLLSFGEEPPCCQLFRRRVFREDACGGWYAKAVRRAQDLGEAYLFTCPANLDHIAFPLIHQGELVGGVIVGPFRMDAPDSTEILEMAEKHGLDTALSLELYETMGNLPVCPPKKAHQIKTLLDHLLSPLLPTARAALMETRMKMTQQSEINETMQAYKGQPVGETGHFLYRKECELLEHVRSGNVREVKALLNEMIGYAMFHEGLKPDSLRIHAVELTTLLSRVAIDGGAKVDTTYLLTEDFIERLFRETDIDDLCLLMQEAVERFMETMFNSTDKGNPYIRKALRYMNDHYADHLELSDVAGYVELSPSYFSSLFHETVGVSFREQLCRIRVDKSRSLLLSGKYTLADIALSVGFPDQSYFSKIFKRIVGMTPSRYRG